MNANWQIPNFLGDDFFFFLLNYLLETKEKDETRVLYISIKEGKKTPV